jgi:cytoskeletal protein CcmA (bactofilin family)
MLNKPKFRKVKCLHCHKPFPVPEAATILTCPNCSKRVRVDNVVVSRPTFTARLETCGKLVIMAKGKLVANVVQAALGIECQGEMDARAVAASHVLLDNGARWKGDLRTAAIKIMPGATVVGGQFQIDYALRYTGATKDAQVV